VVPVEGANVTCHDCTADSGTHFRCERCRARRRARAVIRLLSGRCRSCRRVRGERALLCAGCQRRATYRKKVRKAAQVGCCSNAWCHRTPTPGMKTCSKCRDYSREYKRRVARAG
jgi:hypothetical protein